MVLGLASSPAGQELGGLQNHIGSQNLLKQCPCPCRVEAQLSHLLRKKVSPGDITILGIPEVRTLWGYWPNSQERGL